MFAQRENTFFHNFRIFCYQQQKHKATGLKMWGEITYPFPTSTAQPLQFGNGYVISPHTKHIEAAKKWPPFSRPHFQMHFREWKIYRFRVRFQWNLFPRVQLTISQHWFRWWLGAGQATSHYLNQWWLVCWRIYASPGVNELTRNVFTFPCGD